MIILAYNVNFINNYLIEIKISQIEELLLFMIKLTIIIIILIAAFE